MGLAKKPLAYFIMAEKLKERAYENEIEVKKVRETLNKHFRMGRKNLNRIMKEMLDLGLISYKNFMVIIIRV